jgi:hypothetical protein
MWRFGKQNTNKFRLLVKISKDWRRFIKNLPHGTWVLKECSLVLKEHIENRTEVQVRWNAVNIVEQEGRDDTSIVNDKKKKYAVI